MSFLDKLKNVFFEEEEEEVEENPKLARKVEIPKKQPSSVKVEEEKEVNEVNSFKDFNDFEEVKTEIKTEVKKEVVEKEETPSRFAMMFEEEDFVPEEPKQKPVVKTEYVEKRTLYPEKKEASYTDSIKKDTAYGYTKSYYESKETKTFTPSPIISPIYGILDKNYKKEEVITKKEIKITSTRGKIDLDSVRSKAFGENEIEEKKEEVKVKPIKEEKIYDVNVNKPSVKGVTLEDADEYYRDLGLAYNVDYSDKGKEEPKRENTGRLEDNLFDLIESMYDKED